MYKLKRAKIKRIFSEREGKGERIKDSKGQGAGMGEILI